MERVIDFMEKKMFQLFLSNYQLLNGSIRLTNGNNKKHIDYLESCGAIDSETISIA